MGPIIIYKEVILTTAGNQDYAIGLLITLEGI